MKAIIQVPCFNEEKTLARVIAEFPNSLPGIDEIEYQIINDGCTDKTCAVATMAGVHHIVTVPGRNRRWLGRAFKQGVDNALRVGADILVNTDGDGQYPGGRIADLVEPIVSGRAQIVIGNRQPERLASFSKTKRILQRIGNVAASAISGANIPDAVSGFRAYSKDALLSLNVLTDYTYTLDTLLQAHQKGIDVEWIEIESAAATRPSRLIKSNSEKVWRSVLTMIRLGALYQPERLFTFLAAAFGLPGFLLLLRFFYYYLLLPEQSRGHVQSVVVGGVLVVISALMAVVSILAHLLSVNRRLIEDCLSRVRRLEIARPRSGKDL